MAKTANQLRQERAKLVAERDRGDVRAIRQNKMVIGSERRFVSGLLYAQGAPSPGDAKLKTALKLSSREADSQQFRTVSPEVSPFRAVGCGRPAGVVK